MSAPAPRQKRATKAWLVHGYWVSNQQRTEIQQHRQKNNLPALEIMTSSDDPLCKITSREIVEMLKTMQVNAKKTRTPVTERVLLETDDEDDDQETCVESGEHTTPAPVDPPPKASSSIEPRPVPQELVRHISAMAKLQPPFWYNPSNPSNSVPLALFDHEHVCVHCGQVLVPEPDSCATPKARTAALPATAPSVQTDGEVQRPAVLDLPLGSSVDPPLASTNSASRPNLKSASADNRPTAVGSEGPALPVKCAKRASVPRPPSLQPNEITHSAQNDSTSGATSSSTTPSPSLSDERQSAVTPDAKRVSVIDYQETSGLPPRLRRKFALVRP